MFPCVVSYFTCSVNQFFCSCVTAAVTNFYQHVSCWKKSLIKLVSLSNFKTSLQYMYVFRESTHWGLVSVILKLAACWCLLCRQFIFLFCLGQALTMQVMQKASCCYRVQRLWCCRRSTWGQQCCCFTALMVPAERSAKPLTPKVGHVIHCCPQPFPHLVCGPAGSPVVKTHMQFSSFSKCVSLL